MIRVQLCWVKVRKLPCRIGIVQNLELAQLVVWVPIDNEMAIVINPNAISTDKNVKRCEVEHVIHYNCTAAEEK